MKRKANIVLMSNMVQYELSDYYHFACFFKVLLSLAFQVIMLLSSL